MNNESSYCHLPWRCSNLINRSLVSFDPESPNTNYQKKLSFRFVCRELNIGEFNTREYKRWIWHNARAIFLWCWFTGWRGNPFFINFSIFFWKRHEYESFSAFPPPSSYSDFAKTLISVNHGFGGVNQPAKSRLTTRRQ